MTSTIQAVSFVLLSSCAVVHQELLQTWEDVLVSRAFKELVETFAGEQSLSVSFPESCALNRSAELAAFFKSLRMPVAIWTDNRAFLNSLEHRSFSTRYLRMLTKKALHIICSQREWTPPTTTVFAQFPTSLFLVPDALHPPTAPALEARPNLKQIRNIVWYTSKHGVVYSVSINAGKVYLGYNISPSTRIREYINWDEDGEPRRRLTAQLLLNGSTLTIVCAVGPLCDHPNVETFVTSLLLKNVTVCRFPIDQSRERSLAGKARSMLSQGFAVMTSLYQGQKYAPGNAVPAGYFDEQGFKFFVKAEESMPKEMAFLVAFTWEVWAALLASIVASVFFVLGVLRVREGHLPPVSVVAGPFLRALLQKDTMLSPEFVRHQPTKIVIGCWIVVVLVLSTGFQGSLVSFLVGPQISVASPYRHSIAKTVSQAVESGLYKRNRDLEEFMATHRMREVKSTDEDQQLRMSDLRPHFLFWTGAILISLVVFLAELIVHRHCGRRTKLSLRQVALRVERFFWN